MAAAAYTSLVQQIYISYFGRPADPLGLANYSAQLDALNAPTDLTALLLAAKSNAALSALINSFGSSAESIALYGNDTLSFVGQVYVNVLNRTADLQGLLFWADEIDAGRLTKAAAALNISNGAMANTSAQGLIDAAVLKNKVIIAANFTASIDTDEERLAYSGDAAASAARNLLKTVTSTTVPAEFPATVDASLHLGEPVSPTYVLSVVAPSIIEGDSGTKNLTFTLTLDRPASTALTVNYITSNGSAAENEDYVAGAGAVTFAVGQSTATIAVTITGDTVIESNETFNLTLTGAKLAAQVTAIGTITDDDDRAPVFTSAATGAVAENAAITTAIYTTVAADPEGAALSYTLSGIDAALLDVSAAGVVTLKTAANFEAKTSYSFTVTASDGRLTSSKDVLVFVTDVNEKPVITSSATAVTVAENGVAGAVVYTGTANDVDASTTLTWSLSGPDAASFAINAATGAVSLVAGANYEAEPGYAFTVTATDNGTGALSASQAVTLAVTDVNDAPIGVADVATAISGQPATIDVVANDNDEDAGTNLTPTVVLNSLSKGGSAVVSGNKIIYTSLAGFTGIETFTYTVSDGAGGTANATVTVTVDNGTLINRAPVFTSAATGTIAENAAITTAIYTTVAADPEGATLTYALSGTDAALLDVSAAGVVTLKASANFEAKASYSFTVTASDGRLTSAKVVLVSVTDINERPVITSPATATPVVENGAAGTVVYTGTASDVDASTTLTWTLSGPDAASFAINAATGAVSLVAGANFEAKPTYAFTVTATDNGNGALSASQAVTLAVTDVNDAPLGVADVATAFSGQPVTIDVVANDSDEDAGTNLTPTVVPNSLSKGGSAVVSGDKIIYTSVVGFTGVETFTYTVSDGAGGTATATATVTVTSNIGPAGNDTLIGSTAPENIDGLSGDDTITGGGGLDTITGGDGNDTVTFSDSAAQIQGGAGLDTLVVGADAVASSFALASTTQQMTDTSSMNSLSQSIIVRGFENVDASAASNAITITTVSADTTQITLGKGNDTVSSLVGATGSLILSTGYGNDTITSGASAGTRVVDAGAGNDVIDFSSATSASTNSITAGTGNDTITAGVGTDNINGGDGDDRIVFSTTNLTAADAVDGGAGTSDVLNVSIDSTAAVVMTSVSNIETIKFTDGNTSAAHIATVTLVDANATYTSPSVYQTITVDGSVLIADALAVDAQAETDAKVVILGGGAADVITLSNSANFGDSISGGGGADTFNVPVTANLTSADSINGGAQVDILSFNQAAANVVTDAMFTNLASIETVKLASDTTGQSVALGTNAVAAGVVNVTAASVTSATKIVTLDLSGMTASAGVSVTGGAGGDIIIGSAGNDTISGGTAGANDVITGGAGADVITLDAGGIGRTIVRLNLNADVAPGTTLANADSWTGFTTAKSKLDLSGTTLVSTGGTILPLTHSAVTSSGPGTAATEHDTTTADTLTAGSGRFLTTATGSDFANLASVANQGVLVFKLTTDIVTGSTSGVANSFGNQAGINEAVSYITSNFGATTVVNTNVIFIVTDGAMCALFQYQEGALDYGIQATELTLIGVTSTATIMSGDII